MQPAIRICKIYWGYLLVDKIKKTDIYKRVGGHDIRADLYMVEKNNAPVIIYIHGGGMILGSRKDIFLEQAKLYNNAGFNIVSIDYRLAPETKLGEIIRDIGDALDWVRIECKKKYKMDTDKLAIIGSSAGAYLALMTGTFANKPKAIVSFYGYGDLLADWANKPSSFYRQKTIISRQDADNYVNNKVISEGGRERWLYYLHCRQEASWIQEVSGFNPALFPEKIGALSPIYRMGWDYPPTILLHGTEDKDVPLEASLSVKEKLDQIKVANQFIVLEGLEHDFDYDMKDCQVRKAFEEVISFLQNYLI